MLRDRDRADAAAHRHDHVGALEHLVGDGLANASCGSTPSSGINVAGAVVAPLESYTELPAAAVAQSG
jgi:hypothetical protein